MSENLDPVRDLILKCVQRQGTTLAAVSRAVGRNHAYFHQFINRKTPRRLPEDVRHALAECLGVDEQSLADPLSRRSRSAQPMAGAQSGPLMGRKLTTFPARLSVARAESAFDTPSAFARAAAIDRARYLKLEDGEVEPTLGELYRIFQVSKKPLDWLIRGDSEEHESAAAPAEGPAQSGIERSLFPNVPPIPNVPPTPQPGLSTLRKRR